MTQRASDRLAEVADRLSDDASQSGMVAAEAVRAIEPEIIQGFKDGTDELVSMSVEFLRALFRSLKPNSNLPWPEYYTQAREFARRYAEKGVPHESLSEGLAIYRRTVIARLTEELGQSPYADEVLLLAQSRLGDVVEHLNSSFIRGYLDYTEARHRASQSELHGLYQIASALGRSLDRVEIAEVGLRETLKVLRLQAGAVWTREGARLTLAKTVGLQAGEEEEFESGRLGARVRVVEIASGQAESRVDRITGEWSAIRAELRTKGMLLGAMTVATRLPRTFEPSDLEFVAAVADQIAVALDRARQGGDEFGVAMPDADERHANEVGARVRASLEDLNRNAKTPVPVEFSIGVVAWRPGMDWQAMYLVADKALYVDKRRRHAHRKKVSSSRAQGASG